MDQTSPSHLQLLALTAGGRIPEKYRDILERFFASYRAALRRSGMSPGDYDHLFCGFLDRLREQHETPFTFEPYHRQITDPFDYYTFGVEFLRPLVDQPRSTLRGVEHLERIAGQLSARENVIFLANHQTEADPQAISLLLERRFPQIGQQMIFVAGERVIADPLAKPFSMGRNLLCIYSKRHIDNPPDQRVRKQLHNKKTMERMSGLLSEGGHAIYVAPSGGRDRRNADGIVEVAPFDAQSVEMFYLMSQRALRPCHFYPMALATYEFLPPPETVQVELGEPREATRSGIHLAIGAECDMEGLAGSDVIDKKARREARARAIWAAVSADYRAITAT